MAIALVVFVAAAIQGIMGFGGALVAMPLLVTLVGMQTATPAYAIIGTLATLLNAIRWRAHVTLRDLMQLVVPAAVGIPIGVVFLGRMDAVLVTRTLGAILIGYALYNLAGWKTPPLHGRRWAVAAGFSSGILSGAFNTGGPPVIVYADACGWTAERFRGNLQTYFVLISGFLLAAHALSGHFTLSVWRTALIGLPALVAGQLLGVRLCRYINPLRFRQLVLALLLILGVHLLFF